MSQVANPALCDPLLSAHATHPQLFSNVGLIVDSFNEPAFRSLSLRKRFRKVNQLLCDLIRMAKSPAFLLGAVVDYMGRVNRSKTLKETYTLASFEFWLNHFSELSSKENLEIRAKIAGKAIPRGDYQAFFPIGMDRTFSGTHFVAAHLSPDVDTMIASFWGWLIAQRRIREPSHGRAEERRAKHRDEP